MRRGATASGFDCAGLFASGDSAIEVATRLHVPSRPSAVQQAVARFVLIGEGRRLRNRGNLRSRRVFWVST
jgi:hypothetical protein